MMPRQVPPGAAARPGYRTPVLVLSGAIGPGDVVALCQDVAGLLAGCLAGPVDCDVGALTGSGMAAVDTLARLQLTASRLGCRIRFCRVRRELLELLVFCGLDEVLPVEVTGDLGAGADTL